MTTEVQTESNVPASLEIVLKINVEIANFILKALEDSVLPYKDVRAVSGIIMKQGSEQVEAWIKASQDVPLSSADEDSEG